MLSAFTNRRPWAAALIALVFSPTMGMFYLGRGRRGLAYLLLVVAAYGLVVLAAHFDLLPIPLDAATGYAALIVNIVGAVHCHRLAARSVQPVPRVWFARWYGLLAIWVSPVFLALALRTFLWEPYNIPSSSMEPTLRVGDYFVVSKLPYRFGQPRRGDLVAFISPRDSTTYLKRLIGLPGDKVQIISGSLYLNGERIPRGEVDVLPEDFDLGRGEVYRERLPSGRSYLVLEMSDRGQYDDTDAYDVPPGHYFFLGDNRDNSLDSRADVGFVPHDNLIGRVDLVLWNSKTQKLRFVAPE